MGNLSLPIPRAQNKRPHTQDRTKSQEKHLKVWKVSFEVVMESSVSKGFK